MRYVVSYPGLGALLLFSLMTTAPAPATMRAYEVGSAGGFDHRLRNPQLSPSTGFAPRNGQWGAFFLEDEGGGTVTIDALRFGADAVFTYYDTGFMSCGFDETPPEIGHGAVVRSRFAISAAAGQVASGTTAPGGQIDWGVLSGFSRTGLVHCRSFKVLDPCDYCARVNQLEDATVAYDPIPSTTYDLGTWNFDSNGDFAATPYLLQTMSGGGGAETCR